MTYPELERENKELKRRLKNIKMNGKISDLVGSLLWTTLALLTLSLVYTLTIIGAAELSTNWSDASTALLDLGIFLSQAILYGFILWHFFTTVVDLFRTEIIELFKKAEIAFGGAISGSTRALREKGQKKKSDEL